MLKRNVTLESEKARGTFVKDAETEFCRYGKHYLESEILIKTIILDKKLNNHTNPKT